MNKPFKLSPAGKDYLWGGDRLKREYGKRSELQPLAETWECSTHPDGLCTVADGDDAGSTLLDVLKAHPDYIGTHPDVSTMEQGQLPIMIKFIDATDDLSIQVHPDDIYAYANEGGSRGKTEMWYVLDAAADSRLIFGLTNDSDREEIKAAIADGRVTDFLQKVPVKANDVFYVSAGTIHAIGAGVVLAEVQECSNLTYRLYDYDRIDKNGKKRELHIDKALDVARLDCASQPRQPMRVLRYEPGVARELLCRCRYFEVSRMLINTTGRNTIPYMADELSFRVLLCIDGAGELRYTSDTDGKRQTMKVGKGDCIFVPADSVHIGLSGTMSLLDVRG